MLKVMLSGKIGTQYTHNITSLVINAPGMDTHAHAHIYTHILTHKPKQYQETRHAGLHALSLKGRACTTHLLLNLRD